MQLLYSIIYLSAPILFFGFLTYFIKINQSKLQLLLALSASYIFSVAIMHLLPEAYEHQNHKFVGLFIVIGFCLQLVIDTFSSGIEHGHVHSHTSTCKNHFPVSIIFGLMFHSFLEGLPLYNSVTNTFNYKIMLGLALHNTPIAIAFATLLKDHHTKTIIVVALLIAFSLMAPLGLLTSYFLGTNSTLNLKEFMPIAYGLVIGIFLHISTVIMFEGSENHKYNLPKIIMLLLGVFLAFIIS